MPIRIIKPIFTFRRTQDQASSWKVFVEHLNGARADDAWRSVIDAWQDGSLLRWLERQLPDTAKRVKDLGDAGENAVTKERQEALAAALFGGNPPVGVTQAMEADEKERLRIEMAKTASRGKTLCGGAETRLREMAQPGEDWTVTLPNGVKLEMVWVSPGSFKMGVHHDVTLTKGYWIGKYQFTQEQWKAIDASKEDDCEWDGDSLPVENVSWDEAVTCCKKLNRFLAEKIPSEYRMGLPTEAQWEFAARGRDCTKRWCPYSGGNDLNSLAWYSENSDGHTHDVGQKQPNELGIYDMSGNVWEWCHDWYGYYPNRAMTDPRGPSSGTWRVFRGGSWWCVADNCLSTYRNGDGPSDSYYDLGFRVALVPAQGKTDVIIEQDYGSRFRSNSERI